MHCKEEEGRRVYFMCFKGMTIFSYSRSPESSVMRQPSSSSWAPMDDYTRKAREQAKAQLESITGRMFQVRSST